MTTNKKHWDSARLPKAHLTSVAIRIRNCFRIRDPDRQQNSIFVHWPIANFP